MAANALELARHGRPSNPFYLTGQMGGQPFASIPGSDASSSPARGRRKSTWVPPAWRRPTRPGPNRSASGGGGANAELGQANLNRRPGTSPLDDGIEASDEPGELGEAFEDGPGGDA